MEGSSQLRGPLIGQNRFPMHPFPNGWFGIALSADLGPGEVLPIQMFGRETVMYRSESGTPHVLDAYCPHLGTHLGHRPAIHSKDLAPPVVGDCLRCPNHGWLFDPSGECVDVPYSPTIPRGARLQAWPCEERDGIVWVYHDVDGAPPEWELPPAPAQGEDWTPFVWFDTEVRSHPQEILENGADVFHFDTLHRYPDPSPDHAKPDGFKIHLRIRFPEGHVDVTNYGLGFSTSLATMGNGSINTATLNLLTPIGSQRTRLRFACSVKKLDDPDATQGLLDQFVQETTANLRQDIMIWENKGYWERPKLCSGERQLAVYRQWCQRFYSEGAMA